MANFFIRLTTNKHIKEFNKYLAVSCITVTFDFTLYRVFYATHMSSKAVSGSISYLLGLFLGYFLLKKYVFISRIIKKETYNEIFLFFISGMIGTGITYTSIFLYEDMVSIDGHLGKILAMGFSFFIVYIFRKLVVFKIYD